MTRSLIIQVAELAFGPTLAAAGLDVYPQLRGVWVAPDAVNWRLMVEFELERYRDDRFHVWLRRRGKGGEAKLELSEAAGLWPPGYGFATEAELREQLSVALEQLQRLGLDWLTGEAAAAEPVSTTVAALARQRALCDSVAAGKAAFKSGHYAAAVAHFRSASQHGTLDQLSERFLALAKHRSRNET